MIPSATTSGFEPTRAGLVDYARSLDCIHCGLCLHTCPTYRLTGREASSPRGRVHLMRAVAEGRLEPGAAFQEEMEFCLVCRHCESVCPAGVEFGAMMEHTRDGLLGERRPGPLTRLARWLGYRVVLPRRRWIALAATGLALAQRLGLTRLAALLGARGRALAALPPVPPRRERRPLPARTPADGERRETVALLAGCVMPALFGRVHRATTRVLAATGAEVRVPTDHVCCGALHAHNGDLAGARALARTTIEAFEGLEGPVVVNSAGCGAHMKEYGRLLAADEGWRVRAGAFAARVSDLSEHLAEPGRRARLAQRLGPTALPAPVTWDDPCHLCHGQQVRAEPRALLDLVPGLERVELDDSESCCGSAGVYSLLRPADAGAVLQGKLAALERSGARALVTANPGCQLQWSSGLRQAGSDVPVLHLAEVLAGALQAGRDAKT